MKGDRNLFTGIIEEIGECLQVRRGSAQGELVISAQKVLDDLKLGDSLAVQGVCLTITRITGNRISLDVSQETLTRTNLGTLSPGGKVNLERALQIGGRLGGHIVQGHVDGPTTIERLEVKNGFATLQCRAWVQHERYIVEKGSVSLDGISLTVANKLPRGAFRVAVIPTTLETTTLKYRKPGDKVNLECDVFAKYIQSLLGIDSENEKMSEDFLRQNGFL